jgi:uncharacterized protein
MEERPGCGSDWMRQLGMFLLFLIIGLIIFVVFNHFRPALPASVDPIGRSLLIVAFLTAALSARRSRRFEKYWQLLFAFFLASFATAVDYYLPSRDWLLQILQIPLSTPMGIAMDKLDSSAIITIIVVAGTVISGQSLGSLYLKRGKLKAGLLIGGAAFLIAAAGSIPVSEMFFGGRNLQLERVLPWTPWILIFIIGNAFNEELLFRGLFLQKYHPLLGRLCSNLVIAIPFTLHHTGVGYSSDILMLFAILFPLSLAWGYLMQKTDSLWGSVLFHAGMDIPVVLSIFSTLK